MAAVGEYLRELRQRRGLSLEDVARNTRIASHYLEALESNRFSALPAPVFTRGFIRAYCQALGESPDEALGHYETRQGEAPWPLHQAILSRAAAPPAQREPPSRSGVLVSFVLLIILGMALFAVALMTQPAREERADGGLPGATNNTPSAPSPPPPASEPVASARAPQVPSLPPAGAAAAPTPVPPPAAAGATVSADIPPTNTPRPRFSDVQAATGGVASPYRLVARASEATWIRVRTDDGGSTEETVPAGQTREWVSNRPFVLTLGNAGGVTLELNGRTLPPLGPSGAVISRIVLPPQ